MSEIIKAENFLKGIDMNTILDYLEKAEQQHENCVAVDDGSIVFTWKELARLSRRIGTSIAEKTRQRKPVVIIAEKSSLTLAVMFGVVYAGDFYVVVDPSQPLQRIKEILRILDPELIIVNERTEQFLAETEYGNKIFLIKDVMGDEINQTLLKEIRSEMKDTDILYGIFTSGSTGIPKGIVVSHKAVIDFITHFVEIFGFTAQDRLANQAPFDFDVSVKDIYTCVFTGASLMIIPKEMFATPPLLLDFLCEKKATVLIWAVSALSLVATLKGLDYKIPHHVEKIMFSGEVMPVKVLRRWQSALPHAEYVNLYGPAEITCNCTYYRVDARIEEEERIPIGRAFPGRDVFLLDENDKEIIHPGMIGEICVSGESLSEGYYHNAEETEKRFVKYSRGTADPVRCYRTGDLGFFGKKGELYFSGRKDFQIKHMGHRIELEEIEHAMEQISGLERCVCVMDSKKNRLVAFYIGEVNPVRVKEEMKDRLPLYMIPHKLIKTDFIPITKNGKTDRAYFKQKLR